ncbi:MAG: prolyl aminopeptidase [Gammaproteobacteria bacterium]
MLTLYPAIQPYTTYNISVDDVHTLYIEECGTKEGIPIIYLHGGPAVGCDAGNRRFFDPKKYRIILFDQRGAGKSTPHSELKNNTPQLLIEDLELIRKHCGIKKWALFGGSWGSTLALLYAQSHPNRVTGMILRGIFLARQKDLDWICKEGGASNIYPDYWQEFIAMIHEKQKDDIIKAYYKILTGKDEVARMAAAKTWSKWEAVCATLDPCQKIEQCLTNPHTALSLSKIACHYAINNYFIAENFILDNMKKIEHIPATIIHGRYDMICPIENAYSLHRKWPKSNLMIIRDAGHSSREPGILNAIMHATNAFY